MAKTVSHRALDTFAFQTTLGFMLDSPAADRVAIYRCYDGTSRSFLSQDPQCEGKAQLALEGHLLAGPRDDAALVYRCASSGNHGRLASLDAGCEGLGTNQGPLGYAPQRQSVLNRYKTIAGEHWTTTRAVTAGYGFEGSLGFVLDAGGPDRVALYSCLAGTDHYLGTTCSGDQTVGFVGYVLTSAHGSATRPLYECRSNDDRFTSGDAGCEGRTMVGPLGYALANPVDDDLDGYGPGADCADGDPAIHPGAADVPDDGIDQDCDGRDAPYPAMATTVAGFFTTKRSSRVTTFTSLRLRGAVAGQTVVVSCRGKGCPRGKATRTRVRHPKSSLSILGKLKHRNLRRGAVVEVRLTASRTIGRDVRWEIRAPTNPRRIDRCLNPGSSKAVKCPH